MSTSSDSPSATPDRPRLWRWGGLLAGIAALLSACQTPPAPPADGGPPPPASEATNAKAYRQDAAKHLYARNPERIYSGKLPAMLYAVGVLEVDLDRSGQVKRLHWLRAPRHAPEVMAEIERSVRAAAPFPAPSQVRDRLTYTDVWLWDRSGRFQLDTLSEGQL